MRHEPLRFTQTVMSLAVAILVVAVGYHFIASNSLSSRIGDQERRIDEISLETVKQNQEIGRHGEKLEAAEAAVKMHDEKLAILEKRVNEAEADLKRKQAEIKRLAGSVTQDRDALRKLQEDLKTLKLAYEESLRNLEEFRNESRLRDEDVQRRLDEIEKRMGLAPPKP